MARTMTCSAFIENDLQIKNLCKCIQILGGEPTVEKQKVKVVVPYPSDLADKIAPLYEQYWRHEILVSEP